MSTTLSKIANSILNLSHIFNGLSRNIKIADDSEKTDENGNPEGQTRRRRIVNQDLPARGSESEKVDIKTLLPGKEKIQRLAPQKLTPMEVDLGREAILNDTVAQLAEINQNEFESKLSLIQSVIDYIIKFRSLALVGNLSKAAGNPRAQNIINNNIQKVDDFIKKIYKLRLIYQKIVSDSKIGVGNLIQEIQYLDPNDIELIQFGGEEFQEQINQTQMIMARTIDSLKRINGVSVTSNSRKRVLENLKTQGYNIELSPEVASEITSVDAMAAFKMIGVVGKLVSEEAKNIKTKDLLVSVFSEVEKMSNYRSEDDFQKMFEDFQTASQDLIQGGGEEGAVKFGGATRTLLKGFEEKMKVIIENNNARMSEVEGRIKELQARINSATNDQEKQALEKNKSFEEKKLSIFKTRVGKNIEAREQISRLVDAYQEQAENLTNLSQDQVKEKIKDLSEKIRSIAMVQANLLAIARYQDYISPFKAEEKVKIDSDKLETALKYITREDARESGNIFNYQFIIDTFKNLYIEYRSDPSSYPGEAASRFKQVFPQWLQLIQSPSKITNLLIYFGSKEEIIRDKDEYFKIIQEIEDRKSTIRLIQSKMEQADESEKQRLQSELDLQMSSIDSAMTAASSDEQRLPYQVFIGNTEYLDSLVQEIKSKHNEWRVKEKGRHSVLSQIRTLSSRTNSMLLDKGGLSQAEIDVIKSQLDSILSDRDKAKYLTGRVYQTIIGNIEAIIGSSHKESQEIPNNELVQTNLLIFQGAIQKLIEYFANTFSAGKRQTLQQIIMAPKGRESEHIANLLKLLVEKVGNEAELESIKREIFVEMYMKEYRINEIKTLYEGGREGLQKHKQGMRELVNKIAGNEVTYSSLLEKTGDRITREIDKVIEAISKLNSEEIKSYFPYAQKTIVESESIKEMVKVTQSLKGICNGITPNIRSNVSLMQTLFNREDVKGYIEKCKSFYLKTRKPGKSVGYLENLKKLLESYQKISGRSLDIPEISGATIVSLPTRSTETERPVMEESAQVSGEKTTVPTQTTFSLPPKEKTYFAAIIANSLKNFTTATTVSDIDSVIAYIDSFINNEEVISLEKSNFISHGKSQGFENVEVIEESLQRWIFSCKKMLEKIKSNCIDKKQKMQQE